MNISFTEPLGLAWDRMKMLLFSPVELRTWFVLGFSAWLAGLGENGSGGGSSRWSDAGMSGIESATETLLENAFWLMVLAILLVIVLVVAVVCLWVSSRGKFIFLDNVVHRRAQIVEPWKQFAHLGNSLFFWRLLFTLFCVVVVFGWVAVLLVSTSIQPDFWNGNPGVAVILLAVLSLLAILFPIIYTQFFMNNFVVPIMYKHDLSATAAWGRFLALFGSNPLPFLFFGVVIFVMAVALVLVMIVVGLLSCCAGFLVLAIPYIGTVALLPVLVTYRAYGVAFLNQFGAEYVVDLN